MNPSQRIQTLREVAITHCHAIKAASIPDTYKANIILNRYTKCNHLDRARKLFDEMPHRDSASWNTMISGYVNCGYFSTGWDFLKSMKCNGLGFDGYTFGSILKGVASNGCLFAGQEVHCDVIKFGHENNVYSTSALLDMYAKCGRVEDARGVFQHMPERTTVSWNAMIGGYAETGNMKECFSLLNCMEREGVRLDDGTFAPVLTLLNDRKYFKLIKQVHGKVAKLGLDCENTVFNAMISAYSDCGSVEEAKRVFDSAVGYRDLVTWNSMLAAYLEHDQGECGFKFFLQMEKAGFEPDIYTYTSVVSSCCAVQQKNRGESLHGLVLKRGVEQLAPVSNALIAMYLKLNNNCINDVVRVFEHLEDKDRVTWNTMLMGLSQNGLSESALKFFKQMQHEGLELDHYTFSAVLRSCSDLATLKLGQQVHVLALKSGLGLKEYVASALIFMYSKCGIIEDAWKSFDETTKDSSIIWNSIIFAYAQHGQGKVALDLFFQMSEREVMLDHITFVAVLTACSHIGLVDDGCRFLKIMETHYGITPRMEHYACTIDLLGRAGRLEEAKDLIKGMPYEPDPMVLKTLLAACRKCGDIELGIEVATRLLQLEPGEHCTYILISEMYGHLKKWEEIASMKRTMRKKGVKKVPGWSWIEIQNEVHAFNAEDHSHPHCHEIYQLLRDFKFEMEASLDDVDEVALCWLKAQDSR